MQGARDLVASERGIWCIAATLCAFSLVVIGKLSAQEWLEFVKYLSTALIVSKTVTTSMESRREQIPTATATDKGG